jgi:hypothetical protein
VLPLLHPGSLITSVRTIIKSIMMKQFHLCKATDLFDCGTATFGITKGNIQSVLTLVIRDPVPDKEGGNFLFFTVYWGVQIYERVTSFVSL